MTVKLLRHLTLHAAGTLLNCWHELQALLAASDAEE